jgi:hypothetical protein
MEMGRQKKTVSYSLDPDLLKDFDAWIAAQPVPPTKTAAVEAAMRKLMADYPVSEPDKGKKAN